MAVETTAIKFDDYLIKYKKHYYDRVVKGKNTTNLHRDIFYIPVCIFRP